MQTTPAVIYEYTAAPAMNATGHPSTQWKDKTAEEIVADVRAGVQRLLDHWPESNPSDPQVIRLTIAEPVYRYLSTPSVSHGKSACLTIQRYNPWLEIDYARMGSEEGAAIFESLLDPTIRIRVRGL